MKGRMASSPKVAVIIPTYNEAGNLPQVVEKIETVFSELNMEGCIVIVDDASPDQTGVVADGLARRYTNMFVLHRQRKMGIGAAYKDGFKYAIKTLAPKYLIEMDADGSHNPKYILELLTGIELTGSDLVIASRFSKGGGTNVNVGRKLVSIGANLLARVVGGLNVKDVTSGFRIYKASAVEQLTFERVRTGYDFQVESVFRCVRRGLKVTETPFIFEVRRKGKSKLTIGEYVSFLILTLKILRERVRVAS